MDDEYARTWVESLGGPLVVLPRSVLPLWHTDPAGQEVNDPAEWGDYGRACKIDDSLGVLEVGDAQALVLGDVPDSTTFLPELSAFVRWEWAPSEEALLDGVEAVLDTAEWETEVRWTVPGPVVLFDSVWPGTTLLDQQPENHLLIDLAPGTFRVSFASIATGPETRVGIVRLLSDKP
ncbi:Imm21 family immunity protein [Actinomadura litoris]|uniref:Imm21 family immunity protein n=1 Tax=Actinomadura litoris TaxID=2678616 RepID=UPI001C12CE1F|nr:Imm21 family immunity protein [Actinomadura litoris]